MKILLIKEEGWQPVEFKTKHLAQIQKINKKIKLVVVTYDNTNEIQRQLVNTDILVVDNSNFPNIERAKKLKWIQVLSAGTNKIMEPKVVNSDILISNLAGLQDVSIAEHVLGFMLIFTRRFYDTFKKQQQKNWKISEGISELRGKTVLIVGFGNIGREIGRITNCLGAEVIGVKKNVNNKPGFVDKIYSLSQIDKILPLADFVILSLPLTDETFHFFNMQKFKKMKKTAVIINIGRGPVINEKELVKTLNLKIIGGAALDVTEIEPLPKNSPLWKMDNVIITPHHSGPTEKFMNRAIDIFCANLKAYLKGKPLPTLVDKKRGY
jgi:D-2-hydroxyacid dehydrogenase (NADP+)